MGSWLRAVGPDDDNFRAALEWALARDDEEAILRFASSLWQYWLIFGVAEGREWVERAVMTPGSSFVAARATACSGWGDLQREAGRDIGPRWVELLEETLGLAVKAGDHNSAGLARIRLSESRLAEGRIVDADRLVNDALESCNPAGETFCLVYRSWVRICQNDLGGARTDLERALSLERKAEDAFVLAHVLAQLAFVCALAGDSERAGHLADEGIATARAFPGRHLVLVMTLLRGAEAAILSGCAPRASEPLTELLEILRNVAARRWVAEALEMAAVVVAPGDAGAAAFLLGAVEALRDSLGEPPTPAGPLVASIEHCRVEIAGALGPAQLEERTRSGRVVTSDEAMRYAQEQLMVVSSSR